MDPGSATVEATRLLTICTIGDLILDVVAARGEMIFHGIAIKPSMVGRAWVGNRGGNDWGQSRDVCDVEISLPVGTVAGRFIWLPAEGPSIRARGDWRAVT